MKFYSPLRYPGGKGFLVSEFKKIINLIGLDKPIYIEPYAGGAGVALALLFSNKVERIVINDLDDTIYSFWKAAIEKPEKFSRKIIATPVTVKEWRKQKKIYLDKNADKFNRGFATFFLNRTNRSGVMNAGPIGGMDQRGKYKINSRYNKKELVLRVRKIGVYRKYIEVLNQEGIELTKKYLGRDKIFIYLDPPYFKKGAMLYLNTYKEKNHEDLAGLLNENADSDWILTYDELKRVRELYSDRVRRRLELKYNVYDSTNVRKARELMIFSDSVSSRLNLI